MPHVCQQYLAKSLDKPTVLKRECREFANVAKKSKEIRLHLHLRAGASVRAIRVEVLLTLLQP